MTKRYIVTVTEKGGPAWESPTVLEIEAQNQKEAISKARKQAGWRSRYDPPLIYKARLDQ